MAGSPVSIPMTLTRTAVWQRLDSIALEYLTLTESADRVQVESVVIGVHEDGTPYRLHYQIDCDTHYQVRKVELHLIGRDPLRLTTDGSGHWFDANYSPLPHLDGCIDIDITATPFTNTLPIRRLEWQTGQRRILNMVYFYIPELTFKSDEQEYTCLQQTTTGSVFQFAQPDFTARLTFDSNGLVTDYPDLFRRLS